MQSDSEKKKKIFENFMRLLFLTQIDREKAKIEGLKFQDDYKKFGSGTLLWAKEEYPNYMIMTSLFTRGSLDKLLKTFLPGMKKIVDEYFTFLNDIETQNPKLYEEEISESNEFVFEKTVQPMDLLVAKDPYMKYVNRKLSGSIKLLKPQMQDYSEKLQSELSAVGEQIKEMTNALPQREEFDSKMRYLMSDKGNLSKLIESIATLKDVGDQLKTFSQEFQNIGVETTKKIKELKEKSLPDLPKVSKEFKNVTNEIKEIIDVNDPSWAYQRLGLIKDVDSFHIIFTKFVARLFHILSHDNRDYTENQYIISEKYHPQTRNKLKDFLKLEMKQKYPLLAEYLLSMFNYNVYRKIEAHEIPNLRVSEGIAYIPVSGSREEIEMNLEEIRKILNTYSYFIKALGLVGDYKL
jgi:hypothetical protein